MGDSFCKLGESADFTRNKPFRQPENGLRRFCLAKRRFRLPSPHPSRQRASILLAPCCPPTPLRQPETPLRGKPNDTQNHRPRADEPVRTQRLQRRKTPNHPHRRTQRIHRSQHRPQQQTQRWQRTHTPHACSFALPRPATRAQPHTQHAHQQHHGARQPSQPLRRAYPHRPRPSRNPPNATTALW